PIRFHAHFHIIIYYAFDRNQYLHGEISFAFYAFLAHHPSKIPPVIILWRRKRQRKIVTVWV
ncbi:MAG: hypothetical protein CML59_02840, partial [Rhodobacteraceae bacterium]|nr:hypothetical protein [Paracoccaceae bacterium]